MLISEQISEQIRYLDAKGVYIQCYKFPFNFSKVKGSMIIAETSLEMHFVY